MNLSDPERQILIGCIDSMGLALHHHGHKWTPGEAAIWDEATKILGMMRYDGEAAIRAESVRCRRCHYAWHALFPSSVDVTSLKCMACGERDSEVREEEDPRDWFQSGPDAEA